MKRRHAVSVAVLLAVLGTGCVAPTARDIVEIDHGKEQAALLLDSFAEAVRLKDVERIWPLLPPGAPVGQISVAEVGFEQATWLLIYKGYTIDAAAAVDRVGWRGWAQGRVSVTVPASNFQSDLLRDDFDLTRIEGKWYIRSFRLARPIRGDALDPPDEVMDELRPKVQAVMDDIRNKRPGNIYYQLPKESRFRMPELTFWQRLTASQPIRPVPIFDDLRLVEQFYIRRWPEPDEPLSLAYLSPGRVVAFYEILYDWPEGGITRPDTMVIEITFRRDAEEWSLYMLRLFGEAFPFS